MSDWDAFGRGVSRLIAEVTDKTVIPFLSNPIAVLAALLLCGAYIQMGRDEPTRTAAAIIMVVLGLFLLVQLVKFFWGLSPA